MAKREKPYRPHISKEELEQLYLTENLTKGVIAARFNTSKNWVAKLIRNYQLVKSKEAIHNNQVESIKRAYKEQNIINKRVKTMLERYGVTDSMQLSECLEKRKKTNLERYGNEQPSLSPEINNKLRNSVKEAYSTGIPQEKYRKTCLERYGVESSSQLESVKTKMLKTYKERYQDHPEKLAEIINKGYRTKRANGTLGKRCSREEEEVYQLLLTKFQKEDIIRQYKSPEYPYLCDFYIRSLNIYIEYQGKRFHQHEPFDPNNKAHLEKVEELKRYNTETSLRAIKTWTIRDVEKRNLAKDKGLNLIELFGLDQAKEIIAKF